MNNNNWIKIDNETFYVKEVMVQLTVMAHATIDLSFDIKSYPSYSDIFFIYHLPMLPQVKHWDTMPA